MAELDGQAATTVSQGAEYVTILMGANDACASSEAAMTPVAEFRAQFERAMTRLSTGCPPPRGLRARFGTPISSVRVAREPGNGRNRPFTFDEARLRVVEAG